MYRKTSNKPLGAYSFNPPLGGGTIGGGGAYSRWGLNISTPQSGRKVPQIDVQMVIDYQLWPTLRVICGKYVPVHSLHERCILCQDKSARME